MSMRKIILKPAFDERVCTYWLLSGALVLLLTVVGIPLLLLWFPLGLLFTKRYLAQMECVLTEQTLIVKKGILVRTEKTIPIEKITDLGMVQGPLMRHFGLRKLTVETAGQTAQGALVSLTGIVDTEAFREAVLAQRERIAEERPETLQQISQKADEDAAALLKDIRDTLQRIESVIARPSGQE